MNASDIGLPFIGCQGSVILQHLSFLLQKGISKGFLAATVKLLTCLGCLTRTRDCEKEAVAVDLFPRLTSGSQTRLDQSHRFQFSGNLCFSADTTQHCGVIRKTSAGSGTM